MLCNDAGLLLIDLVDDKLDATTRETVEQHLSQCEHCQHDLAQLQQWQMMARHWQDENVPTWSRASLARGAPRALPWWQGVSLISSTLALLVVLMQVNWRSDEDGVHFSFGARPTPALTEAQLNQKIDEKLDTFARLQQAKFDNRLLQIELEQTAKDKQLLTAALNISRQQNRDGYEQLVDYWQTIRQQDISANQQALRRLYGVQQSELKTLKASIRQTTVPEEL